MKNGVPALAVDPIAGGAKVSAQSAAWVWPAVLAAHTLTETGLDHWWHWCRSAEGQVQAARCAREAPEGTLIGQLLQAMRRPDTSRS